MTNREARVYFTDCCLRLISVAKYENCYNYETQQIEDVSMRREFEAKELASKALRYKPVILQEHDAEPRRLKAILDTATEEIYVCQLTKRCADNLGITIEEVPYVPERDC